MIYQREYLPTRPDQKIVTLNSFSGLSFLRGPHCFTTPTFSLFFGCTVLTVRGSMVTAPSAMFTSSPEAAVVPSSEVPDGCSLSQRCLGKLVDGLYVGSMMSTIQCGHRHRVRTTKLVASDQDHNSDKLWEET